MTAKDAFITALRVIGVLQIIHAFEYALSAFDISAGYFKPLSTTIGTCMTHTVVYFLLGVYLLLGAPAVVRAIFSKSVDRKSGDENASPDDQPKV